jgi:hypothetical protein
MLPRKKVKRNTHSRVVSTRLSPWKESRLAVIFTCTLDPRPSSAKCTKISKLHHSREKGLMGLVSDKSNSCSIFDSNTDVDDHLPLMRLRRSARLRCEVVFLTHLRSQPAHPAQRFPSQSMALPHWVQYLASRNLLRLESILPRSRCRPISILCQSAT